MSTEVCWVAAQTGLTQCFNKSPSSAESLINIHDDTDDSFPQNILLEPIYQLKEQHKVSWWKQACAAELTVVFVSAVLPFGVLVSNRQLCDSTDAGLHP